MVENNLTDALRELITEAVKDFRLPVKNGYPRQPQVLDFDLPPKRSGEKDDFPFVVVRADNGEDDRDNAEMEVFIIIGCYAEDFTANRDCLNVRSRIRNALKSLPDGTLAGKYILQYPIKWDLYSEQPHPYSQLNMKVKWAYKSPVEKFDDGGY